MKLILFLILLLPFFCQSQFGFSHLFDSIVPRTLNIGEEIRIIDKEDSTFHLSFQNPVSSNLKMVKTLKISDMYFGFEHGSGSDTVRTYEDSTIYCYYGKYSNCHTGYFISDDDTSVLDTSKYYFQIQAKDGKLKSYSYCINHWGGTCSKYFYRDKLLIGYLYGNCNKIDTIMDNKDFDINYEMLWDYEKAFWFRKGKITVISSFHDTQYEVLYLNRKGKIISMEMLLFHDEGSFGIDSLKVLRRSKKYAYSNHRYKVKYN